MITEHEELTPEDRLDMAAANKPAIANPLIPTGNWITMNLGKSWSASAKIPWPSNMRWGWPRKNASRANPNRAKNPITIISSISEVANTDLAALMSRVARYRWMAIWSEPEVQIHQVNMLTAAAISEVRIVASNPQLGSGQ